MAIAEMSPEHFENIVQLLIITAAQLVTFHQKITEWTTSGIASTLCNKRSRTRSFGGMGYSLHEWYDVLKNISCSTAGTGLVAAAATGNRALMGWIPIYIPMLQRAVSQYGTLFTVYLPSCNALPCKGLGLV